MTVVPLARVAAIITLAVPRTVGPHRPPRKHSPPFSRLARAWTYPASIRTLAPRSRMPLRCKSIGRAPMTQPPGIETLALFNRPIRGPRMQIEPRILRIRS